MSLRERIGVLGGTFNPVHNGHLILAQGALETLDLTRVLFIPCSMPPHKTASGLLSAEHRAAMLTAAIEDDFRFEFCDIELRRGGVSYAIDTMSELCAANPSASFYFIIGADALLELHMWKDIHKLLELCSFVTAPRPGVAVCSVKPDDLRLDPPWPERLLANIIKGRRIDISSSDVRYRVAEGMSIRYLVPHAVEMYIAEHGLY